MEPLQLTTIPVIPHTKQPAIPGFTTLPYGTDAGRAGYETGHVTSPSSCLVVPDIDALSQYGTTELAKVLAAELATYRSATNLDKAHVYLDYQAVPAELWPTQGPGVPKVYDIKSNGFVRAEPAYLPTGVPVIVVTPELAARILDAIKRDKAAHPVTAQGSATGGVSPWYPGIPDDSIEIDDELSATCLKLYGFGWDEAAIREEWDRVAYSGDGRNWGDEQFARHMSFTRRGKGESQREQTLMYQAMTEAMGDRAEAAAEEAQFTADVHEAVTRGSLSLVQAPEAPATSELEGDGLNLPNAFWRSSAALMCIRAYAYARSTPADSVLYGVLTRLAAARPWGMCLDTGIGTPASLNLFAAICDGSGSGKSIGIGVSAGAVRLPFGSDPRVIPEGSGEGISEAYMGVEKVEVAGAKNKDGTPKVESQRKQVRNNVFMRITEGQSVVDLMERAGSTLGAQLRAAWMGETIGQANGRQETTRVVENYAFGLVAGFQPKPLATLISETHLGTAQRFAFVRASDPAIPDVAPADPGPISITWPKTVVIPAHLKEGDDEYEALARQAIGYAQDMTLMLAPEVSQEIRGQYLARMRGQLKVAAGDEHRNLLRAKLAALLLILESDGTHVVTRHYWNLAGTMLEVSDRVREHMRGLGAQVRRQEDQELGERAGVRKLAEHATTNGYQMLVAKILEKSKTGKTAREIYQGLSKKQKEHFPNMEALRAVLPDEAA